MKIVAPVMRYLGVRDIGRAAAFYRDVLGFEIREHEGATEAVCGPARVRFDTHDLAPLEWEPQEPGSAMVFFETDDVQAVHRAIAARGGQPGGLAKINGVKMQVFEVRDPDGHALWFGQSYNEPDQPPAARMMQKIMPAMPASDVARAVEHYREVLGFVVNHQQDDLAVMDRDEVRLLIVRRTPRSGVSSAYVYVEDADRLYAELVAKGAKIQRPPESHPWGLRDFRVYDLEENEIEFGQPFE